MKKIALLLIVVLAALTTTAQKSKLELTPMFKLGVFQSNTLGIMNPNNNEVLRMRYNGATLEHQPTQNIDYYVCVGGRLQYKGFGVESVNKVYCVTDNFIKNSPYLAKFYIRGFYQITPKIKFQIEHLCIHPIISENKWERFRLRGGHTEISISYGF